MVLALDVPVGSKKVPKDPQLDAAKALAVHRRGADRAVIFNEQEDLIGEHFHPRHIAFGGAHIGQCRQLPCNIGLAGEPLAIKGGDLLAAPFE